MCSFFYDLRNLVLRSVAPKAIDCPSQTDVLAILLTHTATNMPVSTADADSRNLFSKGICIPKLFHRDPRLSSQHPSFPAAIFLAILVFCAGLVAI